MSDLVLTSKDYLEFRSWLNLNLDGLTWQGRFKKEFESFWDSFFEDDLTIKSLIVRFDYAHAEVKIGSLSSWFLWLRDKFISYIFIFKGKTIGEIASESGLSPSLVATILRNYLLDEYPHLDQYFSEVFQVGNILSPNLHTSFKKIKEDIKISEPTFGSREEEIMPSMEVTLFDEWGIFLKRMKADFSTKGFDLSKIKERSNFLKQVRIIQDISILLLLFTLTIYGVRQGNVWYEKYLANKVSIYEPQFTWLNKSGVFKGLEKKPVKEYKLDFDGIKDISKSDEINEFFDPEKYEEETEVTLTSFDNIPRDFNKADKEASQYEGDAENPNGYRETSGGTTKIYRLMMTSSNTYATRDQVNELVKKYGGSPVGDSHLGNDVPGGVYYNIYIPRTNFKDFMSDTMKVNQGKLFESNTSNVKNVPGKTRVFIMVKSI
ncbi:MAG: hypothetical protein K2Q18_14675 [Bdellovibrionales bacterium]|nr:hypothetical protein [Bdellovibrionales bacterium]